MMSCSQPTAPVVTRVSDTHATLSWTIREDSADGVVAYDVRVLSGQRGSRTIKSVLRDDAQSYRLPPRTLAPGTEYTFCCRARYDVGSSDWGPQSDPVRTRTPAGGVPKLVAAAEPDALTIGWGLPPGVAAGSVVGFDLQREQQGTGAVDTTCGLAPDQRTRYRVGGLQSGSRHRFRVRCVLRGREGRDDEWPPEWSPYYSTFAESPPAVVQLLRQLSEESNDVAQFTGTTDDERECAIQ